MLDTWFSSGLWPFATLGWPDDTPELRAFYPTDVLSTARDILFLWVARMVMLGLEFAGDIPFDDVYVHSTIQAPDGRRMSKSLGTGIDPLDLIDGGTAPTASPLRPDARFGLLAMSSTQDVRFNEEKVAQGRQLANKLFNASRLVLLRVPDGAAATERRAGPRPSRTRGSSRGCSAPRPPRRARSRPSSSTAPRSGSTTSSTASSATGTSEIVKPRLYADDNAEVARGRAARAGRDARARPPGDPVRHRGDLVHLPGADGLLMGRRWPAPDDALIDEAAEAELAARSPPSRSCAAGATASARAGRVAAGAAARPTATSARPTHVARLARVEWTRDGGEPVATVAVPGGNVAVLASDAVDLEARRSARGRARAARRRDRARRAQARQRGLRGQGARRRWSRPSATSSPRLREELEAL